MATSTHTRTLSNARLIVAPDNCKGFDANQHVTPALARTLHDHKYRYAIRYVRRTDPHDYDLTPAEVQVILDGGLGLAVVQHVAPEGWHPSTRRAIAVPRWIPSTSKGVLYGKTAVEEARKLGLPAGTMLWCDLEGVDPNTPSDVVITYCNNWHFQVAGAGYNPGIYVGWSPGLNAQQLYRSLRFAHYWGAYNVDIAPVIRGYQLQQRAARTTDLVPGFTNQDFDVDTATADKLGGRITLLTSPGWTP